MLNRLSGVAGVCAAIVACLAVSGAALATIPDRGGAFHGCYSKQTGALRLLDAGRHCRHGERSVTFDQHGQSGARGRDGRNGATGATGKTGTTGKTGATGKTGTTGKNGANGSNGKNGTNGANGTSVAARIRSSSTALTLTNSAQNDPLLGNTWTQQPKEFDVAYAKIAVSNAGSCINSGSPGSPGVLSGEIDLDGAILTQFSSTATGNAAPPVLLNVPIFEPFVSAAPHTLTLKASDNCDTGGHFVIDSVSIDVAAMH